ncbi:MAG: hypothetical protein KDM91_04725 [Verrucomicrobiae bacterium]|nr:hypothetical protein [Verrucomicrobiae bacterium]MCP5539406.1 hypothetical protein [Akkermansiaceae bacterium]MCP5551082.1 hypothetical protein [Akkermansiaceae bacterium]
MLHFRFMGFPVRVHWMFWVVSILLSGALSMGGRDSLVQILVWLPVVFVSILWHELGHAQAHRKYGGYPDILLHGMGGLCSGTGRFTRQESMWITAAGPAASVCLYGVAFLIAELRGYPVSGGLFLREVNLESRILQDFLWVNGFWTLFNILPVLPLDGGQFFQAYMANRNPRLPIQVGLVTAIGVAVWAVSVGMLYLGFFFGYLAYTNWQRSRGTHGGFW